MGGKPGGYADGFMILGSTMGITSLIVLSFCAILTSGPAGRRKLTTFGRGALFLCMALWSVPLLSVANRFRPLKLDPILYRFDAGFGAEWSFWSGQICRASRLCRRGESDLFESRSAGGADLHLAPAACRGLADRRAGRLPVECRRRLQLVFYFPGSRTGLRLLLALPFSSAAHSCGGRDAPGARRAAERHASVHVSTALLIWFNARPSRVARAPGGSVSGDHDHLDAGSRGALYGGRNRCVSLRAFRASGVRIFAWGGAVRDRDAGVNFGLAGAPRLRSGAVPQHAAGAPWDFYRSA